MSSTYVHSADPAPRGPTDCLGGKGASLVKLAHAGHRVPPFFVIVYRAFDEILAAVNNAQQLASGPSPAEGRDANQQLIADFRDAATAWGGWDGIIAEYDRLFTPEGNVAVRSSADVEDQAANSFAGIFESLLYVRGGQALKAAVVDCWASALSERALAFNRLAGREDAPIRMALVIQQMVDARVAGVVFTRDPVGPDRDDLAISAAFGLGTGVVSGTIETDLFRVDRRSGQVESTISRKDLMVTHDAASGGGVQTIPVPESMSAQPCLSGADIDSIRGMALSIEHTFGVPQDIEWAIGADGLYVLQARPITGGGQTRLGPTTVWDNANIVESYPGVTLPLTFSFIRDAYTLVYRQAAELAGVSPARLDAQGRLFKNYLGLFRGRVYYNLNSWYAGLRLLPGFRMNNTFLEQMMGASKPPNVQTRRGQARLARYVRELPGIAATAAGVGVAALSASRGTEAFLRRVDQVCGEYEVANFEQMELPALAASYEDLHQRMLKRWQAPIVNDVLTMVFSGLLTRLIPEFDGNDGVGLRNDLLAGAADGANLGPAKALAHMAHVVNADRRLSELFASRSDEEIAIMLLGAHGDPTLSSLFQSYLSSYGYRWGRELKLEDPDATSEPDAVVCRLRAFVATPELDPMAWGSRNKETQARAMTLVRRALRGTLPLSVSPRYHAFTYVLDRIRQHIRDRERMRAARARVFGVARRLFNAFGERLQSAAALEQSSDVHYLEVEELLRFVEGTGPSANLKGVVSLRRLEFDGYAAEPDPPSRFETLGGAYLDSSITVAKPQGLGEASVLTGMGCCRGIVEGRARVMFDSRDPSLKPGEIIVTRETDPSWVTALPLAAGLIVERGGLLSHAAIIARELAIPTVVGVSGALQHIKSGQRVRLDGTAGWVVLGPTEETFQDGNR